MLHGDTYFMSKALQEAEEALQTGEVPVGAVISHQGKLIAKAHNQCERLRDSSAHAEMLAMTSAAAYLGSKYLSECSLYVTLEPCAMCAAAMYWTQLQHLVYAASDPKRGFTKWQPSLIHPRTSVSTGIEKTAAKGMLEHFFKQLRETRRSL